MNIAVADNNSRKFTQMMMDWWENAGHVVRFEPGANPALMDWADVYWVDCWDSNIHCLTDYIRDNNYKPKSKLVCRPIDWDIWVRGVRTQWRVDLVDKFVCISPTLERYLRTEFDAETNAPIEWNGKLKLIRPGLDLSKFPLKTTVTDGFQVGMVTGNMWEMKGPMLGLNIFAVLAKKDPRWMLHIRGQLSETQYHKAMYPHFIKSRGLEDRVKIHGNYQDMNDFYEQIDVLLVPSLKEAFSYATAEAMSKGIPCVINNFMGADEIWPVDTIYNTFDEAVEKLQLLRGREWFRDFIQENYSLDKMMKEANEWASIS